MILYNFGIFLYGLAVRVVSLFDRKARLWLAGRRGLFYRLKRSINPQDRIIWVHASSLGEFEQGRPLIEAIRRDYPRYKILLTFFSPSGYEIRKNYEGADHIFYLPLDTPRNARRFVNIVNPEITIFIKYEFWLNYLSALKKSRSRTYIISAIFRENSVFFRPYGTIFRRGLEAFDRIFVQDTESEDLLAGIGITNVTVAGDTRFDRVGEIVASARTLPVIERFAAGQKVWVAGSTWPADEQIIIEVADRHPEVKLIIVPHETDAPHIARLAGSMSRRTVFYTMSDEGAEVGEAEIMIVDTVGLLSSIYRYADYAYIGGGFGAGIHNTLEAATFGMPIAFGPNYGKFREARGLIASGAAESIGSASELDHWLSGLLADEQTRKRKGEAAAGYVGSNRGATSRVINEIFEGDS